jgi:hypothetical protein
MVGGKGSRKVEMGREGKILGRKIEQWRGGGKEKLDRRREKMWVGK